MGWDIPLSDEEAFVSAIEQAAAMGQEEYALWSKSAFEYAKAFCENPELLEANRRLFE